MADGREKFRKGEIGQRGANLPIWSPCGIEAGGGLGGCRSLYRSIFSQRTHYQ